MKLVFADEAWDRSGSDGPSRQPALASRHARSTVVTARSEQVDFSHPIHEGDLVEVVARVVGVGRSSMQVDVELVNEQLLTGERKLCTRGRFVMIALDPQGRPAQAPPLAVG